MSDFKKLIKNRLDFLYVLYRIFLLIVKGDFDGLADMKKENRDQIIKEWKKKKSKEEHD